LNTQNLPRPPDPNGIQSINLTGNGNTPNTEGAHFAFNYDMFIEPFARVRPADGNYHSFIAGSTDLTDPRINAIAIQLTGNNTDNSFTSHIIPSPERYIIVGFKF